MKNEWASLELAMAVETTANRPLPIAFGSAKETAIPILVKRGRRARAAGESKNGRWAILGSVAGRPVSNLFLLICLFGLFGVYCCSCVVEAVACRAKKTFPGKGECSGGVRGIILIILLAGGLLFVLPGCVGYVGADVAGPAFVDVPVPGVFVFGGRDHFHDRAFSRRGAASRGWRR